MPIRRLSGRREALTINSKQFKEKIIQYLEAKQYFILATSETDSIFPDIIFRHQFESIENWLEVKDTPVSLKEKRFVKQLGEYLSEYLKRSEQNRFNFWLVTIKLQSDLFEIIFDDLDENEIKTLIKKMIEVSDDKTRKILEDAQFIEIKHFFESSTIIEGDPSDLQKTKEKIAPEPPENPDFNDLDYANQIMNNYNDVEPIKEEHLGFVNLFKIILPERIFVATSPYSSSIDVYKTNPQITFPPFRLEHKTMYTFEDLENSMLRQYVNIQTIESYNIKEWLSREELDEIILLKLLQKWADTLCRNEKMRYNKRTGSYYFPKIKGAIRPLKKKWHTPTGRNVPRDITIPYRKDGQLNFWAHKSVKITATKYWDDYYLRINPRWLFSEDGYEILEDEKADRLNRFFRKSNFNRNKNLLYDVLFWYDLLFKHTSKETTDKLTSFLTRKNYRIEVTDCVKFTLYMKPNAEMYEEEDEEDSELNLKLLDDYV